MENHFVVALLIVPALWPAPAPADTAAGAVDRPPPQAAITGKRFTATRITDPNEAPVIDGVLDDPLWQRIEPREDFHRNEPENFLPPTERTQFQVAYDADYLYVAAQAYYDDPSMVNALQPIHGKAFESDDQLHISLDPFHHGRDAYYFQVNAFGVRLDALVTNDPNNGFNGDWEAIWNAASAINEQGWATEIAIPFKSISFDPANDTWGFNIGRSIRRKGEFPYWTSRGADVWAMRPAVLGALGPITEINQGAGLDIQVSGVVRRSENHLTDEADTEAEPSVDIFYNPDPTVTLAATLNTDFSAAEVDDRIVNLTRFDVQLPEKRDFFLRDANQFLFGGLHGNGTPFFSRRIGLDSAGLPVPLEGGLKFFGRFDDYNVGALAVRQEASGTQTGDTDLYVIRSTRNVLRESAAGFIYTHGDPLSDRRNEVLGMDFNYNNSNAFGGGAVRASAWYQRVEQEGELDNSSAYGAGLEYPNSRYSVAWKFMEIEPGFSPALGFVNRRDIRQHTITGGFRKYFNEGWVKSYNPTFEAEYIDNTNGVRQSERLKISPLYFESIAGDKIGLSRIHWFEHLDDDFNVVNGLVVPTGDYNFSRWNVLLSSSITRRFHASAEFETGDFYDGERFDRVYGLGWRTWKRLFLTLDHEVSELDLPSGEFTTRLTRLGSELAVTADWAWLVYAQFDNVTDQLGVNSRLRWLPRAGRELYFVVNKGKQRLEDDSFRSVYDEYTLKAGYTLRF